MKTLSLLVFMGVGYSSDLFAFSKTHLNSTLVFTRQTAGNYSSIIAYLHSLLNLFGYWTLNIYYYYYYYMSSYM